MDFLISDTSKVSYDRFLAGFTTQQATFTSKNTLPERSCYYIFIDKIPFCLFSVFLPNVFESLGDKGPVTVVGSKFQLKIRPQHAIENAWSVPFFSIFHGFWLFQAPKWVLTAKIGNYFLKFRFQWSLDG